MSLYAELGDEAVHNGDVDEWAADEQVEDFATYVEDVALMQGRFDPDSVQDSIDQAVDEASRRYAFLVGLDRAFAVAHPGIDAAERGELTAVARRFRTTGRLNASQELGALLPRYAWPTRLRVMEDPPAETKADLFVNVTCVSADTWASVVTKRVPRAADVPASDRLDGVAVACAPVASLADVEITPTELRGRPYYRVEPRPTTSMRDRIALILSRLDARGVEIGVMPELTLSPAAVGWWQEALVANLPPPGSRLRLVLVGTGPAGAAADGFAANRAVLLSRRGKVLLVQDKRHGFTLTVEQIRDWGLGRLLGEETGRAEPIRPGTTISVLESVLGRLAVLVCEDLGRAATDGRTLVELGPSHLLAPVLSKPTLPHYWEHSGAKEWAAAIGAHTVVANSLIVEDAMRGAGTLPAEGRGSALGHSPNGDFTQDRAAAVTELVGFRLIGEEVINSVWLDRDDYDS